MLIKQESIASQKLGSQDFWQNANSVLNKGKINCPEILFSASHKAKLFAENFSKKFNHDDSGISLPVFLSRTDLKLHNISDLKLHNITPKMAKKVTTNLDLPRSFCGY